MVRFSSSWVLVRVQLSVLRSCRFAHTARIPVKARIDASTTSPRAHPRRRGRGRATVPVARSDPSPDMVLLSSGSEPTAAAPGSHRPIRVKPERSRGHMVAAMVPERPAFSAPTWLRDLGFASWLLVGFVLIIIGFVWLLG